MDFDKHFSKQSQHYHNKTLARKWAVWAGLFEFFIVSGNMYRVSQKNCSTFD